MSYELFFHLVRTQATLARSLRLRPDRADAITRAIAAIQLRLHACERYDGYLRLMAGQLGSNRP